MKEIKEVQNFMDKSGVWHSYVVTYTLEAGTLTVDSEDWENIQKIIGGTK